jgi:succinate dehydrogenase/fumarate reductase flavoprotein subunit
MEQPSVPYEWNAVADVVVVGFGAAGMAAAVTAQERGADVVISEKAPEAEEGATPKTIESPQKGAETTPTCHDRPWAGHPRLSRAVFNGSQMKR